MVDEGANSHPHQRQRGAKVNRISHQSHARRRRAKSTAGFARGLFGALASRLRPPGDGTDVTVDADPLMVLAEAYFATSPKGLIRLIVIGMLKPGDRISEVQIATSLGESRGPVRELGGQGLLVRRPSLGFYITTFTRRDIIDHYEVRDSIEAAIVQDIARYGSSDIVSSILDDVERIDGSS